MDAEEVKEEKALVPGGDIRQLGNRWLREAFQASGIQRVPRESQFRKLIQSIDHSLKLCS